MELRSGECPRGIGGGCGPCDVDRAGSPFGRRKRSTNISACFFLFLGFLRMNARFSTSPRVSLAYLRKKKKKCALQERVMGKSSSFLTVLFFLYSCKSKSLVLVTRVGDSPGVTAAWAISESACALREEKA